MRTKRNPEAVQQTQLFAVKLPSALVGRLHLEATHRGATVRSIVADALDSHLPKDIRIVVGESNSRAS